MIKYGDNYVLKMMKNGKSIIPYRNGIDLLGNVIQDGLILDLDSRDLRNGEINTWKDRSPAGNDFTMNNFDGTPLSGYDPVTGGLRFDGVDDYGSCNNVDFCHYFEDNFTVIFKIKFNNTEGRILGCGVQRKNEYLHLVRRRSILYFNFYSNDLTGPSVLNDTIYTIAYVGDKDNNKVEIYVDGILKASQTKTEWLNYGGNNYPVNIGEYVNLYDPITIYKSIIYNRALSAEEITHNYNVIKEREHVLEWDKLIAQGKAIPIKCTEGTMDVSIEGSNDIVWQLADDTISHEAKPSKYLPAGTSYVYCNSMKTGEIKISDNRTNSLLVNDLEDFKNISYYLSLNDCSNITGDLSDLSDVSNTLSLYGCHNVTGDLSDVSDVSYYLNLFYCRNITGDLSSVSNVRYRLDLGSCKNITGDLSSVSNVSYYLDLYNCYNITGDLSSISDVSYRLILSNCYKITGDLSSLSNISYSLSLYNCYNITGDLSDVSNISYYLKLYHCYNITGVLQPLSTLKYIYLDNTGVDINDIDESINNLNDITNISDGELSLSGLTRSSASTETVNSLISKGWSVTDANIIPDEEFISIKCKAGVMDFSIEGATDYTWEFPDGTISTDSHPSKTLSEDGTVYLKCKDWTNVSLIDNGTDSLLVSDLKDFKNISYYLDLYYCRNITGDLSSVSNVSYYLSLYGCSNISGDLSDVSNISYWLHLGNCKNITGDLSSVSNVSYRLSLQYCNITGNLSSVSNISYYLDLYHCKNITGVLQPTSTLKHIYLNNTGLSVDDVDQSIINLNNTTARTDGRLSLSGLTRSSATSNVIDSLISKGWSVTDANIIPTEEFISIKCKAGVMDFSISGATDYTWEFPDKTTSTYSHPSKTLSEDGTVYLKCKDWTNVSLIDNNTDSLLVSDLKDFKNISYYLDLYNCYNITGDLSSISNVSYHLSLGNCSNITGDLSSVSKVSYWLSLNSCSKITGDLSSISDVSYWLDLYNCYNITGDLSSISNIRYYLSLDNCNKITGVLQPTSTLKYIYLNNPGLSTDDVDQSIINLNNTTARTDGRLSLSGLTRTNASTDAVNSLMSKGWNITDANVVTIMSIKCKAGLMDFSIEGATDYTWEFPDGTTSTDSRPKITLEKDGTVYLKYKDWTNVSLDDNGTDSLLVSDLKDFKNISYYLSLNDCSNITGDLSSLINTTYYLSLSDCINITGDLTSVSNLSYVLILSNCNNITGDLSSVSNLTHLLRLDGCSNVTGILNPTRTLYQIYLNGTNMSSNDVDQTLINLEAITEVSGELNISGLARTSVSIPAATSLISKGWDITDATVELNDDYIPIKCSSGLMDFIITGTNNFKWYFPDGTTSTEIRPAKTLPAGTSYLWCDNWSGVSITDGVTESNFVGDLSDFKNVKDSLDIYGCINTTGDLSSLSQLNISGVWLNLYDCVNITGNISNIGNINKIRLGNSTLVEGSLEDIVNLSIYLKIENCPLVYGVLYPPSTLKTLWLVDVGLSSDDVDQTVINLEAVTEVTNGELKLSGLTRSSASTNAVNALIAKGWNITDANIIHDEEFIAIKCKAGVMDFSIEGATDYTWEFPDGTTSTDSRPKITLEKDGTVYLKCKDWTNVSLIDNGTDSLLVSDLKDFKNISYYLDLTNCKNITGDLSGVSNISNTLKLQNCKNITGDLSGISNISFWLRLSSCSNITGDLSSVSNVRYRLDLYKCSNITGDLSGVSNVSHYLDLRYCENITGVLQPTSTLKYIFLNNTGLSVDDVDQSLINLEAITTSTGILSLRGLTRTNASTNAVNSLVAKGWNITDASIE